MVAHADQSTWVCSLLQHGEHQAHRSMHHIWAHLDAAHLYEAALLPGKVGIVCLLLFRCLAAALFATGLLVQEFDAPTPQEGLTEEYLTFFTNWTYTCALGACHHSQAQRTKHCLHLLPAHEAFHESACALLPAFRACC